jgi:hypothetical protein
MGPKLFASAIAAASAVGISGCTHLEASRHLDGAPTAGYAYMLDFTQYEIVLTRSLIGCDPGATPKIKFEATITPRLSPDGEQVYVVDPTAMISAFKTSDISLEYKDGRLVGVNASTEDKTGEFIGSVATTVAKVAAFSAGIPSLTAGAAQPISACKPKAIEALRMVETNTPKITAATATLQAEQEKLAELSTAHAVKPTEALRKQIQTKRDAIKRAQKDLETLTKSVTEAKDWLKVAVTVVWPETSLVADSGGGVLALATEVQQRWFDPGSARARIAQEGATPAVIRRSGVYRLDNDTADIGNAAKLGISPASFAQKYPALANPAFEYDNCAKTNACDELNALKSVLQAKNATALAEFDAVLKAEVSFYLELRGSYGKLPKNPTPASAPRDGIRYRVPAAGQLLICEGAKRCGLGQITLIGKQVGPIAQLGSVFNIPFDSPAFASGSMELKFDDQGRLQKAGMKRTTAAAVEAAKAAGTVADQYGAYMKAHQGRELADLQRAEGVLKARKAVLDAEDALTRSPTEAANDEVAYLEAQKKLKGLRYDLDLDAAKSDLSRDIAVAKLEIELAELEAKLVSDPNSDMKEVRDQYDSQAAVLKARKAVLDAEAELVKSERALAKERAG